MLARNQTLLACLIGVALAVPALAQSGGAVTQYPACPNPPPKLSTAELEAAHASYKVGVEAYNRGDYQKALDNFREAFRRDCSKVALLNFISRAYEGKGDKAEAIHALEVYLQRNPHADDAEDIRTRIKNLKAQLGQPTATATATATTTATATATATATPTATAAPTATEAPPARGGHTAGPWIVVGVGAAALVGGVVVLAIGQGDVSRSRDGCLSNPNGTLTCNPPDVTPGPNGVDRQGLNNRGTVLSNVGIIVGAVGLAAVAGGLVWHFVEPTAPKHAALVPAFGPGYAGVSLAGRF